MTEWFIDIQQRKQTNIQTKPNQNKTENKQNEKSIIVLHTLYLAHCLLQFETVITNIEKCLH